MKNNPDGKRTAILVRCTEPEAAQIRQAARRERRTVSAYVIRAVMNRMRVREQFLSPELEPAQVSKE